MGDKQCCGSCCRAQVPTAAQGEPLSTSELGTEGASPRDRVQAPAATHRRETHLCSLLANIRADVGQIPSQQHTQTDAHRHRHKHRHKHTHRKLGSRGLPLQACRAAWRSGKPLPTQVKFAGTTATNHHQPATNHHQPPISMCFC